MPKSKKLNLRSKVRLRYYQIRLATIDVLQKKKTHQASNDEKGVFDEDCFETDSESDAGCDCPDFFETIQENRNVGILNFNRSHYNDERGKKYVEENGRGGRSLDKMKIRRERRNSLDKMKIRRERRNSLDKMKIRRERRNSLVCSCSTGDNQKESRHVSFPADLPRYRFSAESVCRIKPSTTRTVSSDESLNERRALIKRNRSSKERKQRSLKTKHNKPLRENYQQNEPIKPEDISQQNDESLTDEQLFQISLENFYKIKEKLSIQVRNVNSISSSICN